MLNTISQLQKDAYAEICSIEAKINPRPFVSLAGDFRSGRALLLLRSFELVDESAYETICRKRILYSGLYL